MSRGSLYQMSAMPLLQLPTVTDSVSRFGKLWVAVLNSAFAFRNPYVPGYMLPWLKDNAAGLQVGS